MNKILMSFVLIISLMGCAIAFDQGGLELRPGEARAEMLFEKGIGQPWVGGNPPYPGTYNSLYSQYYTIDKGSAPRKHINTPKKYDTLDRTPNTVYFSDQMQAVPYSQYKSQHREDSLWIQGSSSWSQYVIVPQGSCLSLLAISSAGGIGCLYEIAPEGKLSEESVRLFPGYSQIDFCAERTGRYVLYLTAGGQSSNAIVIDVFGNYPPAQILYPETIAPSAPPAPIAPSSPGDTPITITSTCMKGYRIFVDGNYIGTEGTGIDRPDGRFSFCVIGDRVHEVVVYDGQFNYPKTMFFERGVHKIIQMEPGMAVYT